MEILVKGGALAPQEAEAYAQMMSEKYADRVVETLEIEVDGEFVNVTCHFKRQPFERIRRITGYLVGTLDRFNDAKKAEVDARVKHQINN